MFHGTRPAPVIASPADIASISRLAVNWNAKEAEEQTPLPPLPDSGQRVSIETRVHGDKLWTQMIGFKPGAYVVLEKPPGTDAVDGSRVLKDGDSLVIRFLKDGTIYGLRTPVLATVTVPYRLLFVGYPVDVVERSLRSSPRLECYLPCEGQVGDRTFSRAFIRDFSATGCQLRIPLDALEPEEDTTEAADDATLRDEHPTRADGETGSEQEPSAAEPDSHEPSADAESCDEDENRLTLELQLPGEDEIRIMHGDVIEWQTLERFHLLRVKFDEPQEDIFEQLTLYTTRLG